jgi:hypothetical protein
VLAFVVGVVSWVALYHRPLGVHHFVEAISERLVHVVVNSCLSLEASWLPEFTCIISAVVVVKEVLTHPADTKETNRECLSSSVESVQIALMLVVSFVVEHFAHAVKTVFVWHTTVGKRSHSVHALANSIEG